MTRGSGLGRRLSEAVDDKGKATPERTRRRLLLNQVRFDRKDVERSLSGLIKNATDAGRMNKAKGRKMLSKMMDSLDEYTYIKS